jgi:hypothetical protein
MPLNCREEIKLKFNLAVALMILSAFFFPALAGAGQYRQEEGYGTFIKVPADFPPIAWTENEKGQLNIIFQDAAEGANSKHFFKIIISEQNIEIEDALPQRQKDGSAYKVGEAKTLKKGFRLHTHPAELFLAPLGIERKGKKTGQKELFACKLYCDRSQKQIMLADFAFSEEEFMKIINTFRCH